MHLLCTDETPVQNTSSPLSPNSVHWGPHRPVLIFQGGGYDGCLWEWNALFFESGTRTLSEKQPAVSGRAGERVRLAAQDGLRAAVRAARAEGWGRREDHWMLCTTDASWEMFDREFNKGFVRNVSKLAGRQCQCDKCKCWYGAEEIHHTGYRGDGGIGVQFDDNHCYECAEELHEEYCAKHVWPYESLGTRVEAIQKRNEECYGDPVSIFAARDQEAPVSYDYYTSGPELY